MQINSFPSIHITYVVAKLIEFGSDLGGLKSFMVKLTLLSYKLTLDINFVIVPIHKEKL